MLCWFVENDETKNLTSSRISSFFKKQQNFLLHGFYSFSSYLQIIFEKFQNYCDKVNINQNVRPPHEKEVLLN